MEILVLWKSSKKVLQCQFISRGLSEQKNDGETQFHSVTARWIGFPNRLQRGQLFLALPAKIAETLKCTIDTSLTCIDFRNSLY